MLLNKIKKNYPSILFYLLGAIALIGVDSVVSKYFQKSNIADWASLKSYMMIIGPLMLAGGNNLVVRFPEKENIFMKYSFISIGGVSIFMLLLFFFTSFSYYIIVGGILYGLTILFASVLRSKLKFNEAQLALNLWKIFFFIFALLCVFINSFYPIIILALLSIFFSILVTLIISNKFNIMAIYKERTVTKEEFLFATKYMISSFTVACSAYLDIAIVTHFANLDDISCYFRHYTIFTAACVAFSGYVGFVLTPMVRSEPEKWGRIINKKIIELLLLSLLFSIVTTIILLFFFEKYYLATPSLILCVFFSTISFIRIVYIYPTSYIGATAISMDLNGFLISGVIGIIINFMTFFTLYYCGVSTLLSACISSLTNWLIRVISAYYFSRKIYSTI